MTSDCEGKLHPLASEGIRLFNEGKYFEAHEELEAAWREERGKVRELYQGILEAAVTYLHITRGNYNGAVKVYGRSMKWLRQWPAVCHGVDIGQLRKNMEDVLAEIQRLGPEGLSSFDSSLFKPIASDHDQT
ncbi:MAG: DUF309 domain-containing protein [Chloroflexi bacterium]|nr:DUF309 domain-containing protein [Chloroflexota bacterium]